MKRFTTEQPILIGSIPLAGSTTGTGKSLESAFMKKVFGGILILFYLSFVGTLCYYLVPKLIIFVNLKSLEQGGGLWTVFSFVLMFGFILIYAVIVYPITIIDNRILSPKKDNWKSWSFVIVCAIVAGGPVTVSLVQKHDEIGRDAWDRLGNLFFGGVMLSLITGFMVSLTIEKNN